MRDFSQLCDGRLFVHKLLLIQVAKLRTIKSNSEVSTKHSLSILNRQRETLINGLKNEAEHHHPATAYCDILWNSKHLCIFTLLDFTALFTEAKMTEKDYSSLKEMVCLQSDIYVAI